ncbi:phosphoribosylglycinamide formyltransferase [Bacteroidales bacterium OttesenSCG-928-K03]|nr:phosphoribosylglycinamide formyltransferase [Odoribacter sp. OttesenSCG-928-L07]MDL2242451.1 phosphoribosylglycinamide formyltransferase [Bacteroidales bacterium OttesenSCG-928-K03]
MNIAIFASGNGSNAENIANYFKGNPKVNVKLFLTNKNDAYVIERAKKLNIPCVVFSPKELKDSEGVLKILQENEIEFIILAGFLLLVPDFIVDAYPNKIINIHPALLPKFGGKGMYGTNVHNAVIDAKETESGITIHYVNNIYDEGKIIFQAKCNVENDDTAESLAQKIHVLEYECYPKVIESQIQQYINQHK